MTVDVEQLDREIVKAAEALVDWRSCLQSEPLGNPHGDAWRAIREAVAAKRAAMQPKPLSAVEAERVYRNARGDSCAEGLQAVLAECRKRDLAMIEALPAVPACEGWTPQNARKLDDIRRILLDGRTS